MALLQFREASFVQRGVPAIPPVTLELDEGESLAYACAGERCAAIVAMMAAGLVKPSSGAVYVGAFDPCIQPVQFKRMVGFVPHEAVLNDFPSFARYVEYRAALWGLPHTQTIVRARALLSHLDGVHEAFAYPLVGALLGDPKLLVLDRPQAAYAPQILQAAGNRAIFSTHVSQRDADRFSLTPVRV